MRDQFQSEAAVKATRSVLIPEILDVEDLAHWLRCSPSTARAHLRSGQIPGRRIGRRWLVARDALLLSLTTRPAGAGPRLLENVMSPPDR
jgi:hypothetical protein